MSDHNTLPPDDSNRINLETLVDALAPEKQVGQPGDYYPSTGRVLEDDVDGTMYLGDGDQWLPVTTNAGLAAPAASTGELSTEESVTVTGDGTLTYGRDHGDTYDGESVVVGVGARALPEEEEGLFSITRPPKAVFAGYEAGRNSQGVNCVGVGNSALRDNTGGVSTGIGNSALRENSGTWSTGVGGGALLENAGSSSNGVGRKALRNNTGNYANGLGNGALSSNSGDKVVGIGDNTGEQNTGNYVNFIGTLTGHHNTGDNVIGIGNQALRGDGLVETSDTSNMGDYVIAFGTDAGRNNTGEGAILFGRQAGVDNSENDVMLVTDRDGNERYKGHLKEKTDEKASDLETLEPGAGIIVTSNDGSERKRITIDNTGSLVAEAV